MQDLEIVKQHCLYFGCWSKDKKGHFLHRTSGWTVRDFDVDMRSVHLPFNRYHWLDGFFNNTREQSKAQMIHLPGWSIMCMYDYSADGRGASNAAFLIPKKGLAVAEALQYARAAFPEQVARIEAAAPIVELT